MLKYSRLGQRCLSFIGRGWNLEVNKSELELPLNDVSIDIICPNETRRENGVTDSVL